MSSQKKPLKLHPMIEKKYKVVREIGHGAYGVVCAATNLDTKQNVAIKKVSKIFDKPILAKRALRELKLLRHFRNHENITSIFEMEIPEEHNFNEIYFIQELMEADLHQIIRSEQPLTDAHYQYFIYQVLRGLKYIHSANVLHRDLKPGNLLVNANCELKICDFGLARGYSSDPEGNAGFMTEYVATRWYRAPEIMLCFHSYTKAIDMWSVGCILAEMLGGRPLFKGRDYVDQLNQILAILGMPDEPTLQRIGSQRAQLYIRSLPKTTKVPFSQLYPKANPLALDLLEKLLQFDPSKRPTVEEALAHEYLKAYHDPSDEPTHPKAFDFTFEQATDMEHIKLMIKEEIANWKLFKTNSAPHMHRGDTLTGPNRDAIKDVEMSDDEVGLGAQKVQNKPMNDDELERELSGNNQVQA